MKTNKNLEDKFIKFSGIFLISVIVFAIIYTVIGVLTKPVVEVRVTDVRYAGINNSNTRIWYATVEYEYEGEWYETDVEVDRSVDIGDKLKYYIDPEEPWNHNGFILYNSPKEIVKIMIIIIGISIVFIIPSKIRKHKTIKNLP